ncbi:MATE family Na+-driven efflux transporter [Brachyspira aalborgi]|uniref:MATE family Na+-driven efflux transporter n=1 Tax=Brachyspira aalborgi TaxID=29522 RepID=UPI002664EA45|nr:MATE family Na+-driven efflux transporter [Brachyspira aalborgi]
MINTKLKSELNNTSIKLLLSLIFLAILPSVYSTLRIYLLGSYPDDSAINIASQQMWLGIIYEVLQEAIIAPMFFFIGKINNNDKSNLINKIRTSILIILIIYLIMALLINVFSNNLVSAMRQNETLINQTATYIKLESFANIFIIIFQFFIIINVALGNYKEIFIVSILKTAITVIFDFIFISQYPISINIGVNGIAYNNILSNFISIIILIVLLNKNEYNIFSKEIKFSFLYNINIGKINIVSGFESFYRNFIFSFMILRMVNIVGEQGNYWIANNFFWAWLLIPSLQLGEMIKSNFSKDKNLSLKPYILLNTVFIIIWIIFIPLYKYFIKYAMNIQNYKQILFLIVIILPFYIIFTYGNIITNIFYGISKPQYILLQSFIVNTLFYGIFFILY